VGATLDALADEGVGEALSGLHALLAGGGEAAAALAVALMRRGALDALLDVMWRLEGRGPAHEGTRGEALLCAAWVLVQAAGERVVVADAREACRVVLSVMHARRDAESAQQAGLLVLNGLLKVGGRFPSRGPPGG
jgi:hypothetical protein